MCCGFVHFRTVTLSAIRDRFLCPRTEHRGDHDGPGASRPSCRGTACPPTSQDERVFEVVKLTIEYMFRSIFHKIIFYFCFITS